MAGILAHPSWRSVGRTQRELEPTYELGTPRRCRRCCSRAPLVRYNSSTHTVSANARVRWKYYRPGSELRIVYNEERDSEAAIGVPGLLNTP